MVPAIALIATVVSRRYRQISRRIQGMMGSVTGTVEESVGAHREVRIYGGQPHEIDALRRNHHAPRRLNLKIAATNAAFQLRDPDWWRHRAGGAGLSRHAAA